MATAGRRNGADRADGSSIDDGTAAAAPHAGELAQRQLVAGAEAMSQLFARYEAMQRAQLHVVERAALLHRQAADNLRKASSPMELASVQGTLLVYQFQEAMRFWQEWMTAATRAGGEVAQGAAAGGTPLGDGAASPAASAMNAAMSAAGPMAEAFQQMFVAPLQAAAKPH